MAWDQTRNQIIKRALRIIGVLSQGNEPSSAQLIESSDALNGLMKSLSAENIWLWKMEWIAKKLAASSEVTGSDSLIYTCIRGHTSDSTNKPITGDQWKLYWKKEGSTGGVWVTATAYNCIGDMTLGADVLDVYKVLVRQNNDNDIAVPLVSRNEYANLSRKNDSPSNVPIYGWIDKQDNQRLYLYPFPDAITSYIVQIHVQKVLDDLVLPAANPDVPLRFYDLLCYGLAEVLADEYGLNLGERGFISGKFNRYKRQALNDNTEDTTYNTVKSAF